MTVPYQRLVRIHKNNKQKEPFLSISINLLAAVYQDLKSAPSFFIYIYFCCNKDKYVVEFSPSHIEKKFGFPKSTARDHFNKLIEKGYLVRKNEKSNMYDFYAEPQHLKIQTESVLLERIDFGE
jgi:hypothetical protein